MKRFDPYFLLLSAPQKRVWEKSDEANRKPSGLRSLYGCGTFVCESG
jgi:hypothetical protein